MTLYPPLELSYFSPHINHRSEHNRTDAQIAAHLCSSWKVGSVHTGGRLTATPAGRLLLLDDANSRRTDDNPSTAIAANDLIVLIDVDFFIFLVVVHQHVLFVHIRIVTAQDVHFFMAGRRIASILKLISITFYFPFNMT